MAGSKSTTWAYVEDFQAEDEALLRARYRAEELGCEPVSNGVGAFLATHVAACAANSIVEIGSGTGVSGLWLHRGLETGGVLTTLDISAEVGRAAAESFAEAGIPKARTRLITGSAADVLPRLSGGAYDLVFVDADKEEVETYVTQSHRLLRPGGSAIVHGALWRDRVADPARRDDTTTTIRNLALNLRDNDLWRTSLLPVGDGLLIAVKRSARR